MKTIAFYTDDRTPMMYCNATGPSFSMAACSWFNEQHNAVTSVYEDCSSHRQAHDRAEGIFLHYRDTWLILFVLYLMLCPANP